MEGQNRRDTTTVLITGAAGFAGSHLAEECARRGWNVHGTARPGERAENLAAVPEAAIHRCELSDADAVRTLVEEVQPAQVYHLAAQASVHKAWQDPMATLTNNIAAQLAILRAVQATCPEARVLIVSSSEVDVRDVVRAYVLALREGEAGAVYNVASGHGISMADLLQAFLDQAAVPIERSLDPDRLRPIDRPLIVGDATRLRT